MANSNIALRRKKRTLEAKRDQLLERRDRDRVELAKVRAELKGLRANK